MKYLAVLFLMASGAQAAQINLDCLDENQTKLASIYTPTFVYNQTNLKADLELDGEEISIDIPFGPSVDLPGVYVAQAENLTMVGIPKTSVFAPQAEMKLDIIENGLSILTLTCTTTVNNPAFPRD